MTDISTIIQYLVQGDLLGFFQAIFVSSFLTADVFYVVLTMLFTVPLYIRTKSLLLLSILWVLIGSLIIAALPMVAGVAILLVILGISGTLFKLFFSSRS